MATGFNAWGVNEDGVTPIYPAGFVHLPKIDAEFIQHHSAVGG